MSRHIRLLTRISALRMLAGVLMVASLGLPLTAQTASISGTLKNAVGSAVPGALVTVRNESRGLTFMVASQEDGRYTVPNLLPGRYSIQGVGVAHQSEQRESTVVTGQPIKIDLVLNAARKTSQREARMTDDDYAKLMPESEQPGGDGRTPSTAGVKELVISDCKECHSLQLVLASRKTKEQWKDAVERMYNDLLGRRQPL